MRRAEEAANAMPAPAESFGILSGVNYTMLDWKPDGLSYNPPLPHPILERYEAMWDPICGTLTGVVGTSAAYTLKEIEHHRLEMITALKEKYGPGASKLTTTLTPPLQVAYLWYPGGDVAGVMFNQTKVAEGAYTMGVAYTLNFNGCP
jgi:hypothetical protein